MGFFTMRSAFTDCVDRISQAMEEAALIMNLLQATPKHKHKGKYVASWDADRKHAISHLQESKVSLGAALSGLIHSKYHILLSDELKLANDKVFNLIKSQQKVLDQVHEHLDYLPNLQNNKLQTVYLTVKRLKQALAQAETRAVGAETARSYWEHRLNAQKEEHQALHLEVKVLKQALAQAETRAGASERAEAASPKDSAELVLKLRRVVMSAVHPDKAANIAESEWRTQLCQALFPEIDRLIRS